MSRIIAALYKLLDDIGRGNVDQTRIALFISAATIPFPLLSFSLMNILNIYYPTGFLSEKGLIIYSLFTPLSSIYFLLLTLLGFVVLKKIGASKYYVHLVIQSWILLTFGISFYVGIFSSPMLNLQVLSIGIASMVFSRSIIIGGLTTLISLLYLSSYLQITRQLPSMPFVLSPQVLAADEIKAMYVIFFSVYIIFFWGFFYILIRQMVLGAREKQTQLVNISAKLSRYLSPQVYESIFSTGKDVLVESHKRPLTIFVSDIKNFTQLTDNIESEALTDLLNHYLGEMSQIALKHGGTIDKYIGDAIVVFFGDPESLGLEQDAKNCVMMAIEMRNKMHSLQSYWFQQGVFEPLQIRMGVNSGDCLVGNFGSNNRLAYSVLGSEVHLAEILESFAPPDNILISEATHKLIKDSIQCSQADTLRYKSMPINTFLVNDIVEDRRKAPRDEVEDKVFSFLRDINYDAFNSDLKKQILDSLDPSAEVEK